MPIIKNKRPIAILEQFIEKGKRYSYMIEFMGHRDYWGDLPEAIVLFKIYDKSGLLPEKPKGFVNRMLDLGKYKKELRKYKSFIGSKLIENQIHP